jgi:hypothetical protein
MASSIYISIWLCVCAYVCACVCACVFHGVQVAAGEAHVVALAAHPGGVFSWGRGRHGALGHGDFQDVHTPKQVHGCADSCHAMLGTCHAMLGTCHAMLSPFLFPRDGRVWWGVW